MEESWRVSAEDAADIKVATLVMEWILVERMYHPFLRIRQVFESHSGPIWVELTGPSGTQDLLKSEFALSRWL